jgi:hypothetical protein
MLSSLARKHLCVRLCLDTSSTETHVSHAVSLSHQAVGGGLSAGVLYPLQVIKTVLQSKSKTDADDTEHGVTKEHRLALLLLLAAMLTTSTRKFLGRRAVYASLYRRLQILTLYCR